MTNALKEAYMDGVKLAFRQESIIARLRKLLSKTPKETAPTMISRSPGLENRFFVDPTMNPGLPKSWRTPSGGITKAPEGKAVMEISKAQQRPPWGTNWIPSAEGQNLLAGRREPLVIASQGKSPALSDRFEGWSY